MPGFERGELLLKHGALRRRARALDRLAHAGELALDLLDSKLSLGRCKLGFQLTHSAGLPSVAVSKVTCAPALAI